VRLRLNPVQKSAKSVHFSDFCVQNRPKSVQRSFCICYVRKREESVRTDRFMCAWSSFLCNGLIYVRFGYFFVRSANSGEPEVVDEAQKGCREFLDSLNVKAL